MSFDPTLHTMRLKGKEYLPVAARVAWLRAEHPDAIIESELVTLDLDAKLAVFRATVTLPSTGGRATDYGSETAADFGDFLEKSSTKSIGRACALLGYGTMMALELDEGAERIVDSPVERKAAAPARTAQQTENADSQLDALTERVNNAATLSVLQRVGQDAKQATLSEAGRDTLGKYYLIRKGELEHPDTASVR